MVEFLSFVLGLVATFPWKNPLTGLLQSIIAAGIGYLFVPSPWALVIFAVSIALAIIGAFAAYENSDSAVLLGVYFFILVGQLSVVAVLMPNHIACAWQNPTNINVCVQKMIDKAERQGGNLQISQ